MGFIKQGREVARKEHKKNLDRQKSARVKQLLLKEDEETKIVFTHEEPTGVYVHKVRKKSKKGNFYWAWIVCTIDEDDPNSTCIMCSRGHRPTYQNAYLVIDRRKFETIKDRNGNYKSTKITMTKRGGTLFVLMVGQKSIPLIEKKYDKFKKDFLQLTWEFYRTGSNTDTAYHIEKASAPKIKKLGESKEEKELLKLIKAFTWEAFFALPPASEVQAILRVNGLLDAGEASGDGDGAEVDDSDEGEDVDYD